jgi:SAM-dependent methyltransferase
MEADPNAYYGSALGVSMYDLFSGGGLLRGDIAFYLECAERFGGPILELGAGSGRITMPLANAGYDIVGLDLSPTMLQIASGRLAAFPEAKERVVLVPGDMTEFELEQRFKLTIVAARSFQHVVTPAKQRAVLDRIRRHLLPGGHLVLDLFDPNFEMLFAVAGSEFPSREMRDPRTGRLVRRTVVARHNDPLKQTISETLRFEVIDPLGNIVEQEETFWTLRWSTRQETKYLLELCGFEAIEQYSDFKKTPPDYGREQLWIARAV